MRTAVRGSIRFGEVQGLCAQIATDGETRARIDALSLRMLTAS
ncbi:hypothetical protein [Allobranchiibius huperziae]|uniref:Uncharacterized protein n=1 Tax=Allobranchiibius huperziae TaxID=1874116 RepID=A0A853DI30_9MICO|nr:hypothetical protein [Allobranchiibius huperziae]NYJ74390.1 hypothetical protein [Allobranchiibius huperziae]